ncbi:hypothetical protein CPB83DRAFT_904376 [Crepidotus variabilis]|uniref:Uncharacterized protein n=1 Tax=Crepidotus variabilis TaxID=179855 RepID=A0A9P6JTF0_9AGAR|nr:hypothetical protein CPB83DRAFT_904376 [Crepidotus variabilis]
MDDPWANAWGESSKSVLPEPSSDWSAPSVSALHGDREDDLSNPSWPKETITHWAADDVGDTSIWGGNEAASSSSTSVWNPGPSTFDKISLGGESYPDLSTASPHVNAKTEDPTTVNDRSATPSPSSPSDDELETETSPQALDYRTLTPPSHVPPPISIPPAEDPDGFGSFATASTEEAPTWTLSKPSFQIASADAATWGGGWEDPGSASAKSEQSEDSENEEDEWEAARRQKEMQDKHVPPELLASILEKMNDLSNTLWPDKESGVDELDKARHIDFESLGLQSAAQKLIPEDLVLPMNGAFTKTFTSKQLSESLKLTRHSFIAKSSPMAMYMLSKGSTSWEASIKARAAIAPEDVTPAGWKIVEQAPIESSAEDGKKKAGFFSFFGRKAATASVDSIKRPGSPASISGVSSIRTGASPRPSVDSNLSSIAPSTPVTGRTTPSVPVPEANPIAFQISESKSISAISPLSETSADGFQSETIPPSAVSRFLGRFSGKSRRSASRDSLALSTDDIEFLAEVPTASPSNDVGNGPDLDALSLMLKAPPPPLTTTLPPPLPPPPKPAQLPRIAPPPPAPATSPPLAAPTPKPVTLSVPTPPPPILSMTINDDFEDFWEAPASRPPSLPSNDPFSFFDAPPTNPPLPRNSIPQITPVPAPVNTLTSNDDDGDWAPFDVPAPQPTKPIAPMTRTPVTKQSPPTQVKRSFVPIMNSSRSSTPVNAKSSSTFSLPPPPTFTQSRSATSGHSAGAGHAPVIAPLAPPPSASRPPSIPLVNLASSNPTALSSSVSAPAVNHIEDDDDFADFLSSPPAGPSQIQPTSFVDFTTPTPARVQHASTSTYPVSAGSANNSSDNFGFLDSAPSPSVQKQTLTSSSSSLATGRKMSLPGINSTAKPSLPSMKTSSGHVRKVSREADHARTQSLLDSAAARGRWLAPPSPIPEALSPPPDSGCLSPPKASGFDGASTMQAQQAHAVASIASKSNGNGAMLKPPPAWNFPAPPSMNAAAFSIKNTLATSATPPPQALPSSFLQPTPSLTPISAPSQTNTRSGGLSAQDLSFFEGL